MNETPAPNKRLDAFVDSLLPETNLGPTAIAKKFSLYHQLSSPPSYQSIISVCLAFVNEIEQKGNLPDAIRGFHCTYNNHTQLILKDRERTGAIVHTLLHEIFEIIIEKLNKKINHRYELSDYKANLFAASVLMPKEAFFEWALKSDLDFKAIWDNGKYGHLSFTSLLIRLRYLFRLNKIYYLGLVAENKKAYYRPEDINNLNNFEVTATTRSSKDPITFNNKTLPELLSKCLTKLIDQMNEQKDNYEKYKKSVTLEESIFLIKASPFPFLNYKYDAIKTIVMQIVHKKDYEAIRKAVKP